MGLRPMRSVRGGAARGACPFEGACRSGARPSPVGRSCGAWSNHRVSGRRRQTVERRGSTGAAARRPNQSTERSEPAERHHRPKAPLEGGPRSNRRPRGRRLHSGRDRLCQGGLTSRRPQDGVPAPAVLIRLRCARVLTLTSTGTHGVHHGDWIDRCSRISREAVRRDL